jgi:hypothetical protein
MPVYPVAKRSRARGSWVPFVFFPLREKNSNGPNEAAGEPVATSVEEAKMSDQEPDFEAIDE